jgi:chemosensory pili system protein ChpA (sensor histidine kinase/response regulator)
VLTDLEMPNLNGLDLTRRLRGSPAWAALPVVMISSRGTDKHRSHAEEVGVSAYLTKPYTDGELLNRVRELLPA